MGRVSRPGERVDRLAALPAHADQLRGGIGRAAGTTIDAAQGARPNDQLRGGSLEPAYAPESCPMSLLMKPAATGRPVHELIRARWSPRAFADRPVATDTILVVLEAGRWAASSNNAQPWRWIVATRDDAEGHANAVG